MNQEYLRGTKTTVAILSLIVFFAVSGQLVSAQTTTAPETSPETPKKSADTPQQNSEVQQLKEKVRLMEQTVEELKKQISAVEQSQQQQTQQQPVKVIPAVYDDTTKTTTTTTTADNSKKPADKDDKQGESTFEIYGFAMLDAGYQFGQNHPDWFDVVRPVKLPSFQDQFAPSGKTFWGVRQSRLGVKTSTPTRWGELKTQFEFELFGTGVDAGQTTFRLRHAYGEIGQFGAGQTNSVFMDGDVFPNTIEYWGPNGMVLYRNVQFRWMPIKGRSRVTIAVERPGASADQSDYRDRIQLQGVKPKIEFPDLTAEARYGRNWGYVEIAGILRQLKWSDTNKADPEDLSGSDLGWGLNLSSNVHFTKRDIGRFQVVYGEGIENYLNDADVDVGVQITNDPNRPIKGVALPILGIVTYLDHTWNKKFTSSIGYSFMNIENSSGQNPDAYHRGHYASTNLLFTPVDNVMLGGEFIWGRRENWRDGFASNDYRLQFAFKYNFSKVLKF
ncbi:MAG TPA: DcaP family trimeric outer membrane transporter [Pyrinomonadaceae bacterium]|jgi:hypothetical protein